MKRVLASFAVLFATGCLGYEGDPDLMDLEAEEEAEELGEVVQALPNDPTAPNLRLDGATILYAGKSYQLSPGKQISLPCSAKQFTVSYGYANVGGTNAAAHQNILAFSQVGLISPQNPLQAGLGRFASFQASFGNAPANTYRDLSLRIDDPSQVFESNEGDNRIEVQVRRLCLAIPL